MKKDIAKLYTPFWQKALPYTWVQRIDGSFETNQFAFKRIKNKKFVDPAYKDLWNSIINCEKN